MNIRKLQHIIILILLLFGGCTSDLRTKVIAKQELQFYPKTIIEDYFSLTYVENHAVAMGILNNVDKQVRLPLILVLQSIICLGGLFLLWKFRHQKINLQIGLAILISGALGNFLDRLQNGYVTDFIHFHYLDKFSFPVFNIADLLINIGVIMLILQARAFERAINVAFQKKSQSNLLGETQEIQQ